MAISDLLGHRVIVFDGAMGTALQEAGLALTEPADVWNITHADAVKNVHLGFLRAGSDAITTNTFGATANVLEGTGHTVDEIVAAAVENARAAIETYEDELSEIAGKADGSKDGDGNGNANADGNGSTDRDKENSDSTTAGVFTCIAVNPEDGSAACGIPDAPALPVRISAHYIAAGFGPCRRMVEMPGGISFEDAYDLFKEEVIAAKNAGADLILFETFSDVLELKAAVLAAKENTDLPVFATMTFQENERTLLGTDVLTALTTVQSLGVDAFGLNCSLGPVQTIPIVKDLTANSLVHIIAQPNAGLPAVGSDGSITYDLTADEFADSVFEMAEYGAAAVGGCCGTNAAFIKALKTRIEAIPHEDRPGRFPSMDPGWFSWKLEGAQPAVCSATETIFLDRTLIGLRPGRSRREEQWLKPGDSSLFMEPEYGPVVLPQGLKAGHLDPAANEEYRDALISGEYEDAAALADDIITDGADLVYIGAVLPDAPDGYDEAEALTGVVRALSETGRIPLVIEGSGSEVIGKALRIAKGKPGVSLDKSNPVGKEKIRAVAEKYGAEIIE
jgi:5-methyltetrahydrofolate--homocysteine methyltransferase